MAQAARSVTMEAGGFVSPGPSLIHDRDPKFGAAFQDLIEDTGVARVVLPPRSPHVHAYAARWVRSVKEACLVRVMLVGARAVGQALNA
jgi:putative transposase